MIPSLLATCVTVRQHKSAWRLAKKCWFAATRKAVLMGPRLALITLLALVPAAGQQSSSFQVLGPMPGSCEGCDTYAAGISADGSTIVGAAYVCPDGGTTCTDTGKTEAFRWTVAGGYELLGDLGGPYGSYAYATSADGSVVMGDAAVPPRDICGAFRWTAGEGMQPLPYPPLCTASAVSADGASVVGGNAYLNISGQSGIFRRDATAMGLSPDGQIAVGYAINGSDALGPTNNAFTWMLDSGLRFIGVAGVNSGAFAISADGAVIVGEFQTGVNSPYHASRWTAEGVMVDLGVLGSGAGSAAFATNADGSVVFGASLTSGQTTSSHGFRWTAQTGMQDLNQLLNLGDCGAHPWPPDCFRVQAVTGVSADGTLITGYGLGPQSVSTWPQTQPFRAIVPLP